MAKDYLSRRRELLASINGIASPSDLLDIQTQVVDDILRAEASLRRSGEDEEARHHISQLRLYMDGLVWKTLHPHAIRQLAKPAGGPPFLLDQKEAVDVVLEAASEWALSRGIQVLVSDITNVIKMGDLVLVGDPEYPAIVECKKTLPKPQHLRQGRKGRQISRALGTSRYLSGKPTKVYGQPHPLSVIESDHRPDRNWPVVERSVLTALATGECFEQISKWEFVWAGDLSSLGGLKDHRDGLDKGQSGILFYGSTLGLLNGLDGLFPVPAAWKVSQEVQFALMERQVELHHFLSGGAFEGDHYGAHIAISDDPGYCVKVTYKGQEYPFSRRLILDVVYGFETESATRGIVKFAEEVAGVMENEDAVFSEMQPQPGELVKVEPGAPFSGTGVMKLGEHQLIVFTIPEEA